MSSSICGDYNQCHAVLTELQTKQIRTVPNGLQCFTDTNVNSIALEVRSAKTEQCLFEIVLCTT